MKHISSFLLFILCFVQLTGQELFDKDKLNTYFDVIEAHNQFMGSVALSHKGEIIYSRALGYSNIDEGIKNENDTRYVIGSISKTFTSVLVFKAIESNLIELETPLSRFFPSVVNSDVITIDHLLSHTSGLENYTNCEDFNTTYKKHFSKEELVDLFSSFKSDFKPGTSKAYSNSNYLLLSCILERIHGKAFETILRQNIVTPLKLSATYLGKNIGRREKEALPYVFGNRYLKEEMTSHTVLMGAGGIVSTASDLLKFADHLFYGNLVSKESLEKMYPKEDAMGKGLFAIPFYDRKGYGHSGGIDGFSSLMASFEQDSLCLSIVSNGSQMKMNDVAITLLSAFYNKEYQIPEFSEPVQLTLQEMEQFCGVYASDDFPSKFTVALKDSLLTGQLEGQSAFPLTAKTKTVLEYAMAGVVLQFNLTSHELVLKQAGSKILYKNEQYYKPKTAKVLSKAQLEELKQYCGVYSSQMFPVKYFVSLTDTGLTAKLGNQPALPLTETKKHHFEYRPADVTLEFKNSSDVLVFKQGDFTILFSKDN